jgi:hypothetical protein
MTITIGRTPVSLVEGAPYNLLAPLRGGRTRLEGTSYYRNENWSAQYWRVWSGAILRTMHHRVLQNIKRHLESK